MGDAVTDDDIEGDSGGCRGDLLPVCEKVGRGVEVVEVLSYVREPLGVVENVCGRQSARSWSLHSAPMKTPSLQHAQHGE